MRARKKFLPFVFLGILSLLALMFFFFFINPEKNTLIGEFELSPVLFFFLLISTSIFSFTSFLLANIRLGFLVALFLTALLFLRYLSYTSLVYIGILLVIVILLELGFRKR